MAYVGCSFDSFSIFLLSLKQQQNLMKILFSCIHFEVWSLLLEKGKQKQTKNKQQQQKNGILYW